MELVKLMEWNWAAVEGPPAHNPAISPFQPSHQFLHSTINCFFPEFGLAEMKERAGREIK